MFIGNVTEFPLALLKEYGLSAEARDLWSRLEDAEDFAASRVLLLVVWDRRLLDDVEGFPP